MWVWVGLTYGAAVLQAISRPFPDLVPFSHCFLSVLSKRPKISLQKWCEFVSGLSGSPQWWTGEVFVSSDAETTRFKLYRKRITMNEILKKDLHFSVVLIIQFIFKWNIYKQCQICDCSRNTGWYWHWYIDASNFKYYWINLN